MLSTLKLLLPALVPSWRFFKSVQPSPRVQWRSRASRSDSDWQEFRPRPDYVSSKTMLARLFWNPAWNEALYAVSLAERLTVAPTAHAEDELFRLIARTAGGGELRFRLLFVTRDTADVTFQSARRVMPGTEP